MIKKRWQEEKIKKALHVRRVVMLTGARQCGKTTLAKAVCSYDFEYRTLDNSSHLKLAKTEPEEFIEHDKKTMVIDEVQRAPELIFAIKQAVDKNTSCGQFLITGSADIQSLPTVKESLAGRVKNIRLRPFSYGEYLENPPKFLERLYKKNFIRNNGFNKKKVIEIALRGGFPEPLMLQGGEESKDWYRDYIDTLLKKDLKDFANIKRQNALRELVHVAGTYSSNYINKVKLSERLGISRQTTDEYLNILENIYLIDFVPVWSKIDRGRIGKQVKMYMNDTGLMSAILDWHYDDVARDSDKSGNLIETFVYNQISAQVDLDGDVNLYHYRDYDNHEIDMILESKNEIMGIEIKSSSRFDEEHFKNLRWFAKKYTHKPFFGIVIYTGDLAISFNDNMYLVPINNLWE